MSVDNTAILMVGRKDSEVDLSKLPDMTQEEYDDRNGDLWSYSKEHLPFFDGLLLDTRTDNGYDMRYRFIGFVIKETRSYGFDEIPVVDFQARFQKSIEVFFRVFGVEPKILLIEHQS